MTVPPSLQPVTHLKLPAFVLRPRRSHLVQLQGWLAAALLWLMLVPVARAALDVDVEIHGVSDELLANVRAFLTVEQQRKDPTLTVERLQRYHQKAPAEIAEALHPFGYYQAETKTSLSEHDGRWTARYDIDTGLPVLITDLNISLHGPGENDAEFKRLVGEFPLHVGDVLDQRAYTRGKEALQRSANERGYFDFNFIAHELIINPAARTAAVELGMDTGPRYKFGAVRYHQDVLRPAFLSRFADFKSGDPYEIGKLLELQSALFDSDYFSNVEINPQKDQAEDLDVPIDVNLIPRPRQRYLVGAGYGTDTGARGRLGWENRRINDRGHRFRSDYQWSEVRQSLSSSYIWPIRNPRTDQVALTATWLDDRSDISSSSEIFSLALSRTYARRSNWLETLYIKYQTEAYQTSIDNGDAVLLMPGVSWSRVIAQNRIYPANGIRFIFDVRGAHPALLSNREFVQLRAQSKAVYTLATHHRFIVRGDIGNTLLNSVRSLPTSVRFFTGGSQSVRGYDFNSLAPRVNGQVVGGERLMVASAEYEYRFTEKWSGAVFFDTGNAVHDWQEALKQGAGLGVRWLSPVGPIRIDYAWALSEPGMPQQIHINVGPDL